jgi:hypothetical protein
MPKILDVAISQIGIQEDTAHTNHGEAVKYQIAAGLPKYGGFPWCQSFVYWCGMTAYGATNPIPKTGGVLDCWHRVDPALRVVKANATPKNIVPGSQFILSEGNGNGHTGIVESVDADGRLHTIEGNSNNDGSRDGYEVCRQTKRHISDANLLGFIVYKYSS